MSAAMMRIWGLLVVPLALALAGCFSPDTTPDYRYRLTVEVETPEVLKTGSSVIEVEQSMGRSGGDGVWQADQPAHAG